MEVWGGGGGNLGAGIRQGHPDAWHVSAGAADGLYLCRFCRGTWFCRRHGGTAAILHGVDPPDPERANGARPRRHVRGHGCGSGVNLPYPHQHRDGGRLYAGHRYTLAADELRRIVGTVYVSGAGYREEYSHAPVRELECMGSKG